MATTLFTNAFVMSCSDQIGDLEQADVLVEGTKIAKVGSGIEVSGAEKVDASGMILMPGMIDTHSHLWETPFKGRVSEGWGMEYFTNIHPMVSFYTAEDAYAGIYAGLVESLAAGVRTGPVRGHRRRTVIACAAAGRACDRRHPEARRRP